MGPLGDVRVVDLSHLLNGPFCTMLLGHLGAEIIKVEPRSGDRYRRAWMSPGTTRDGYGFIAANSNKKSITLDLKGDAGRDVLLRLIQRADVLVENFNLGVMEGLGLAVDVLFKANPMLIYARSNGFGYSGRSAHRRANAGTNMAVSGWTHAAQEMAERPGAKVLGVGDQVGGISMALGICAALHERDLSGEGQIVEVSMQEALLGFMTEVFHTYFEGEQVAEPPKRCKDGYYAFRLPDVSDAVWTALCEVMGAPELSSHPEFATARRRNEHRREVSEILDRWFLDRSRGELEQLLSRLPIPNGPVLRLEEVLRDEHLSSRRAFVQQDHPHAGAVTLLAPWIRLSRTPGALTDRAPLLGEHSKYVFCEVLGGSDEEFERLADAGVM